MFSKKNIKQKILISFAVSLIIYSILYFSTLNNYFFNLSYDAFNNLKPVANKSNGVIIIGIDDKTLARYDKTNSGVIPRDIYSEFLNKVKKYKPAAVAFDILFDIKSNEDQNKKFLNAIRSYGDKIVLSSYFQRNFDSFEETFVMPYSENGPGNLFWGYVNVFKGITEDDDSLRRRFKPFERAADKLVYSLPVTVLNNFYEIEIGPNFDFLNFYERETKNLKMSVPVNNGSCLISYPGQE